MTTLPPTPDPGRQPSIKDRGARAFRLVVLVNSSESASKALEYAFQLAGDLCWQMHLIHVIDLDQFPESGNPVSMGRLLGEEFRRSASRLESYKEIIECNGIKVTVAEPLVVGIFQLQALQEHLLRTAPDLVIVGRGSFNKGFLKTVVMRASWAVMIVPEAQLKRRPSSLLLYSDGRGIKESNMHPVLGFAARTHQQVSVLSVVNRKKFGMRKFQSFLPSSTAAIFVNFYQQEGREAVSTIEKFALKNSFDMISVILRDHWWFRRLFYRWSFIDLAFRVDIPLLVFKAK